MMARNIYSKALLVLMLCFNVFNTAAADNIIQEFDVDRGGDYLLLPFKLNGTTYQFVIDTGSEISVFDNKLQSQLGKPIRNVKLKTENGYTNANIYQAPRATIGELLFGETGYVVCTDLSSMREASGKNVNGVLGMDFLKKHVIQIDFDQGKVRFISNVDRSSEDLGEPIRLGFMQNKKPFLLAGTSPESIAPFYIDTANNMTGTLAPDFFDELKKKHELKALGFTKLQTLAGLSFIESGKLRVLAVKGSVLRNLIVKKGQSNSLGLRFWSHYHVTFDFPNKVVFLRHGQQFSRPDHHDQSGLHLLRIDGRIIVNSIDTTSPAAKAEIHPTDEIIEIDEENLRHESLFQIREYLRNATNTIDITVNRDGQIIKVKLSLQ